ncbi:glycoside hydrolase family 5 [Methylobacterium sp. 4-46]|nr:glycoside hydrolase family 5 [Methylobacterium sp. 4-46]
MRFRGNGINMYGASAGKRDAQYSGGRFVASRTRRARSVAAFVVLIAGWLCGDRTDQHSFANSPPGQADGREYELRRAGQMWDAAKFGSGTVRGFGVGRLSDTDLYDLAGTGANVVRKFLNLHRAVKSDEYVVDAQQLVELDRLVTFALNHKFKVVVTFEPLPNQFAQEFWDNSSLKDSIVDAWRQIAKRYEHSPAIAAYDLINEPITKRPWDDGGQEEWLNFATKIVAAIREIDPKRVVVFEPSPGGLPFGFSAVHRLIPFSNIVYSAHVYQPHQLTHQGLYSYKMPYSYPGIWNKSDLFALLAPVKDFAKRHDVNIYIGEFSAVRWAPGCSAERYVSDAMSIFEAEKWSWSYHAWREYQGWDLELPESWFRRFPYKDAKPQGFETADQSKVRVETNIYRMILQKFLQNTP